LAEGGVLLGKAAPAVAALLGEPMIVDAQPRESVPTFDVPEYRTGAEVWYYDLGDEKQKESFRFMTDGAVLAVIFRAGQVTAVRKVAH
jgi:hypothetical protein